jgi:hypothetical protein
VGVPLGSDVAGGKGLKVLVVDDSRTDRSVRGAESFLQATAVDSGANRAAIEPPSAGGGRPYDLVSTGRCRDGRGRVAGRIENPRLQSKPAVILVTGTAARTCATLPPV